MFCRSLFVLLYFFFWPLCCLFFFDILILITPLWYLLTIVLSVLLRYTDSDYLPLVSSNSSYILLTLPHFRAFPNIWPRYPSISAALTCVFWLTKGKIRSWLCCRPLLYTCQTQQFMVALYIIFIYWAWNKGYNRYS
jgi:hypothetical protein